jgi:hypothetical protein
MPNELHLIDRVTTVSATFGQWVLPEGAPGPATPPAAANLCPCRR